MSRTNLKSLVKMSKFEGTVEKIDPDNFGKHSVLEGIIEMMKILNDGDTSRTRFVFWFDN